MSSTTGIQLSCTLKVARLYEFNTEIYHTGKNWETLTWRAYDTQAALSFGATLNSLNFTTAAETGQTHRYGEATGRPRWHREERGNIQFKSHSWTANRKIITLSSKEWLECDRTRWRRRPESINHDTVWSQIWQQRVLNWNYLPHVSLGVYFGTERKWSPNFSKWLKLSDWKERTEGI